MRFLHIADVHLDTSFAGRSEEVRARLREASRQAFRNAVDLAIREDVHALLIAGDLFDGDRLSFQTERFLLEQVGRLNDQGISVVYATGNHDPGLPQPIALASPISTGTLEQAYLSLRLTIVDHLDEGAEKLPIFVDEAFVNWDEERRDRGLLALSELSKTRQVFAFTCHPDTAARLEQLGGRILRLQR